MYYGVIIEDRLIAMVESIRLSVQMKQRVDVKPITKDGSDAYILFMNKNPSKITNFPISSGRKYETMLKKACKIYFC